MAQNEKTIEHSLEDASDLLANDPAGALDLAHKLIANKPEARAFRFAAAAFRALNREDEAARAELQAIQIEFPQPLKLARSLQQSRRSAEAKAIADEYLRNNPDDLIAMTISAEASLSLNSVDDAEQMLRSVVKRAPLFAPANLVLANALVAQLRLHEAAEILAKLLEGAPQDINAKRFLADLLGQMNDPAQAAALYQEVLAGRANQADDHVKHAHFLRAAGLRSESVRALRQAIGISPLAGTAWWTLAHYYPEDLTEEDEEQIRAAVRTVGVRPTDLGFMQLALSILEHRRGNHQAAFEAITAAQSLLWRGPAYDPASLSNHVDELIANYTSDLFRRRASEGSKSDSPIFIVGMPRSGSTLLERILGEHSKIEPIGESPVIPRLVALAHPDRTAAYTSLLPGEFSDEQLGQMAEWYLERSQEFRRTDKAHFTDKYNGNWIRAGLIRLMFPNARILDIRRDPLDCCWAVFKSVRVGDYANDQRHLARYYVDYIRFMDAIAAASPGTILTVRYEDLVKDVEGETRRILEFLGLEFEPACVKFHQSSAAVATASSEQVRRPIYSGSIGSAEPYRPWLEPLIAELDLALAETAVGPS